MNEWASIDLWVDVVAKDRVVLTILGGKERRCFGRAALTDELLESLGSGALDATAYGTALFEAILPVGEDTRNLYRLARDGAISQSAIIRFKLTLSLDLLAEVHRLRWERLVDPEKGAAIARDPWTVFSRCAATGAPSSQPIVGTPNLLIAVADPSDIERHDMVPIDRKGIQQKLEQDLAHLRGQLQWSFLDPPVTAARLRSRMLEAGSPFHALHLIAHGFISSRMGSGVLVMERENGTCEFLTERALPDVFLGLGDLRLLTLMTCDGAVLSDAHPLSGLGRRLVRPDGLPAVISMQDVVSFQTAEQFTNTFYHQLCRHDGRVDAAINETRLQLFLTEIGSSRWSDPILFMRLEEGALWRQGSNEIKTSVADATGRGASVRPVPEVRDDPDSLFVGIGATQGLPVLSHCADSARSLGALFATRDAAGTDFHTRILSSPTEPRIGREVLLEEIDAICEAPRDRLAFFYSGYGWIDEGCGYLLTEADAPEAVYLDEIISRFRDATASSVTLLFECHRPAQHAVFAERASQRPPIHLREGIAFLACEISSEELEAAKFGLFSELLLNSLDGAAADVQGKIWPASVYAHAERVLRSWAGRVTFRTGGSEIPLRHCPPRVADEDLEQIPRLFSAPESYYQLTPSHESSHRTSVPTDVRALDTLRTLRDAGLVSVEKEKNLYFAALESRRIQLTRLGQLYWRLAREDRL